MQGGYTGKMLFVDLTAGNLEIKPLSEKTAKQFIGGYGIGARVLYDTMKPGVDPLGPGNVLGFVTGPLNGTGVFFGGRYTVVCKSPVTGGWNDANSGGYFGPELKKAGFDAVFVSGISEKPVYLWINGGTAEIRSAESLWGKDCIEVLDALKSETGEEKMRAAVIGPAGENLSLISCVMNDGHRAAGRGGLGAVMGSKKLKAVVVRGTLDVPVADKEKVRKLNKAVVEAMKAEPNIQQVETFRNFGTGAGTGMYALNGDSPVKNWGGVGIRDMGEVSAEKITSMAMNKYKKKSYACASCPLACGAVYEVDNGKRPLKETHRPEYETSAAFGSMCLNDNAKSIIKCNDICNRAGLDTISTGATVAWAIECYENGLLTKEETDGLELNWGNAEAIVAVTKSIAENRGFGKILALGSKGAAEKMGKGEEYLVTVKGIELPMHDPKIGPGYSRTYQFDPTPARHVKGGLGAMQARDPNPAKYEFTDTGAMDLMMTTIYELLQVSGACLFSLLAMLDMVPRAIEAVTGWTCDAGYQSAAMMRIMNIRHAFNLREGLTPADFVLPGRAVGEPPQDEGPHNGRTIDHKILAKSFFDVMQWDGTTGKPSKEILESLGGLEDVTRDLYG